MLTFTQQRLCVFFPFFFFYFSYKYPFLPLIFSHNFLLFSLFSIITLSILSNFLKFSSEEFKFDSGLHHSIAPTLQKFIFGLRTSTLRPSPPSTITKFLTSYPSNFFISIPLIFRFWAF